MSIRIVSTHPSHTHAEVCVCVFWWSPHVWKFDPNSISVSPWIEGLGCVCTCVSVCAPVCSRYWSFDPGSPWRQWLRQHHAGDKIDVYSTPKQLQNINTEATVVEEEWQICWYHTLQLHTSVHLPCDKWRSCGVRGWKWKGDGIHQNPRKKITLWKLDAAA